MLGRNCDSFSHTLRGRGLGYGHTNLVYRTEKPPPLGVTLPSPIGIEKSAERPNDPMPVSWNRATRRRLHYTLRRHYGERWGKCTAYPRGYVKHDWRDIPPLHIMMLYDSLRQRGGASG
ncbi:MAG: hypothetical protein JWO42_1864 [Chloroflexi bacterium]|nr:hypothetical protein [Chloroflexota bacterium]